MLVDFIDFNGCDVLKEEKAYVYFFSDEIVEELGYFVGVYNFSTDFAGDTPQRASNDGTFECSAIPTMIKEPIKR